jgi:hypothetical protein
MKKGLAAMTPEQEAYGPNVAQILNQATRVVKGRIPAAVRKELMNAVKDGVLGHLKKDGLKPEIFFHPNHVNGAVDRQKREAEYAIKSIAGVVASGAEKAEYDFARETFQSADHSTLEQGAPEPPDIDMEM